MSKNLSEKEIVSFILENEQNDIALNVSAVKKSNPKILRTAIKLFGSWQNAIEQAGLDYSDVRADGKSISKWTKEDVIHGLRNIEPEDLIEKNLRNKYGGLYAACIRIFGSRKEAIEAAGLDYEKTLVHVPWTKSRIISVIQMFHLGGLPINFKYISTYHSRLRKRAEKFFGSWGDAVEAAGLNYEEVKKNKGWAKPFLGEDGRLYVSQTEGIVANELLRLKNEKKIIDYKSQELITPGRNWTCDFIVKLLNNADFYIEVDGVGDKRKKKEHFEEKIDFYKKGSFLYYKVTSPDNIANIVERYSSWYSIPIKNSLITAHKNPDGDALSSAKAVYNFLASHGVRVCMKFTGEIPKNLSWILDNSEVVKRTPDWVENIIVLDCAPSSDRTGWELPDLPIYNIDHHAQRISENDPDNNIHVIDSCSTASILLNRFGIMDDILVVGVYTDTSFTRSFTEFMRFLHILNIDEDKLGNFISRINSSPSRTWNVLKNSVVHKCRNGFIIVETAEKLPDVIESLMQVLSKINESVCLIYGNEGTVKLRTSNPNLDLSVIAREYSGGGHPYASMCNVTGKISEFKNRIISMDVPEISFDMDGYEELKEEEHEISGRNKKNT